MHSSCFLTLLDGVLRQSSSYWNTLTGAPMPAISALSKRIQNSKIQRILQSTWTLCHSMCLGVTSWMAYPKWASSCVGTDCASSYEKQDNLLRIRRLEHQICTEHPNLGNCSFQEQHLAKDKARNTQLTTRSEGMFYVYINKMTKHPLPKFQRSSKVLLKVPSEKQRKSLRELPIQDHWYLLMAEFVKGTILATPEIEVFSIILTNTCTYIKLAWGIHPLGASDHIPSTGLGTTPLSGRKDIQRSDASKTSNTIRNGAMALLCSDSLAFEQSGLLSISPNYQTTYQALDFPKAGLSLRSHVTVVFGIALAFNSLTAPPGNRTTAPGHLQTGCGAESTKAATISFWYSRLCLMEAVANTFHRNNTAGILFTNASVNQHHTCSLCQVQGEFWEIHHGYKDFNHPK